MASGFAATNLNLGGFTLTKVGANTISLVSTTTTAGTMQVSGGSLALGVTGSGTGVNGAASALILDNTSGVSLSLGQAASIGSLAGGGASGGDVSLGANTLTVGALGTDTTYAGVVSGTGGGLTKTGGGILTLTGANTYTGGTAIAGGTLALGSAGALGTTGTISFGGGTLQFSAANTTDYAARFSTAASQAYRLDTNGQTVTLGTALSSAGGSLTKSGNGTLTLTAAQGYDTLNANLGTTNLNSTLGTGTSTLNANATVNIYASQTLAALNIADGVEVTFGDGLPFAGDGGKLTAGLVPEPGSLGLLCVGILGFYGRRRRA